MDASMLVVALLFFVTLILGVPIAFILGFVPIVFLYCFSSVPLGIIGQTLYNGLDSYVLLALPFFILAGNLMNHSGITADLVKFAQLLVGGFRGGLAQVNIVVSVFFAGLTGAAVADTAVVGSLLIPAMKEEGYSAEYAAAVTTASSIIGPIIPPSNIMVIYGAITGSSIGTLFMAGFIPGLLVALCLMIMAYYYAVKENHPRRMERIPLTECVRIIRNSLAALVVPLIIIGGILGGFFTATEAGAVACLYALLMGVCFYKTLTPRIILECLENAAIVSATILLIISTSKVLSLVLAIQHVPGNIAQFMLSIIDNKYVFLIVINVFLLFVGMVMEIGASVILLAPILLPVAVQYGIHPLHFAIIMLVNLNIGLTTPPLGVCLFVVSPIAKVPFERIVPKVLPFVCMQIVALLLLTFIPELVFFVPRLMGML